MFGIFAPWPSLFLVAWIPSPRGGGGACLPFLKFWVPPPPPGGGRPRVGWDFWGKTFVTKILISPLSSGLPELVSTPVVHCYTNNPGVLGSNLRCYRK